MRHRRSLLALLVAAATAVPAWAQPVVSDGPDAVSVTIYRDPGADLGGTVDLDWLGGYALISERRTVTIPRGRAVIRFEGVAGGILPESALVTGLPGGVREKNLDADLLRPYSLYARSLGRPVTIRRETDGRVVEERAIIRSGPDGAAVLQTAEGFITADCGGPDDQLVYENVPEGLTARPTLSIETESSEARQVTVTLSYLAWGFDWRASYVARMQPQGKSADLFAWVTLANTDVTSFADAETMVVAGKLQREDEPDDYLAARRRADNDGEFSFRCLTRGAYPPPPPPPPMPAPPAVGFRAGIIESEVNQEIIVTGARVQLENFGDLKLYRLPHRTDVAANSQKQVAMIDRQGVPLDVVYRAILDGYEEDEIDVELLLRAQNRKEKGLGIPLPAGSVAVFERHGEADLLIGEATIRDKAVNEEVELALGEADQVTATVEQVAEGGNWEEFELTVGNANPWPVRFEGDFRLDEDRKRTRASMRLGRKNGRDLWSVEVPANGSVKLRYRIRDVDAD